MNMFVRTVQIFRNDIGIECGMKKCSALKLKRGKIVENKGRQLLNEEMIKEENKDTTTEELWHQIK